MDILLIRKGHSALSVTAAQIINITGLHFSIPEKEDNKHRETT